MTGEGPETTHEAGWEADGGPPGVTTPGPRRAASPPGTDHEAVRGTADDEAVRSTQDHGPVRSTQDHEPVRSTQGHEAVRSEPARSMADREVVRTESDRGAALTEADSEAAPSEFDREAAHTEAAPEAARSESGREVAYGEAAPEAARAESGREAAHTEADHEAAHSEAAPETARTEAAGGAGPGRPTAGQAARGASDGAAGNSGDAEEEETPADAGDSKTRVTVLVALAANLVIAVAKAVGGLLSGSPALLSEAAHSVADSLNEIFLLASLKRSRKKPDRDHPFGYGKERYFWALLAAVGIFVMGGCFSFFQGFEALRSDENEGSTGYVVGLVVLAVALVAEGTSLARALLQLRASKKGAEQDPTLRTVLAEDSTAVLGVVLAMLGMALHWITGNIVWEASASFAIGALLVYIAYRLGSDARAQLIGEAVDQETLGRIRGLLGEQPEIDNVADLLTMKLGMDSALVAARIDLAPGMDSERVELVCVRIKDEITRTWPDADQVFLDITEAPPPRHHAGDRSR